MARDHTERFQASLFFCFILVFDHCAHDCEMESNRGMRKPQHDGDLRRNRSGGDKGVFVMIYLIRLVEKQKKKKKKKRMESNLVMISNGRLQYDETKKNGWNPIANKPVRRCHPRAPRRFQAPWGCRPPFETSLDSTESTRLGTLWSCHCRTWASNTWYHSPPTRYPTSLLKVNTWTRTQ